MRGPSASGRRFTRTAAIGAVAAMALWATSSTSMAASPLPAAIASKLVEGSDLGRVAADANARQPVIIEFAMPSLPDSASFVRPDLADAAQTSAVHAIQDQILGRLFGSSAEIAKAESSPDLVVKRMDFSPLFGINVTRAELEKLAADPAVVRIHEDKIDRPMLLQSLPLIQMPAAYATGATGSGFHVAVLDTGARRSHEFLGSRIVRAACFSTTNAQSGSTSYCPGGVPSSTDIDSANDCDEAAFSGCGHGTHTNGIAAGFNTNLQAGEPQNGVARDARLININVFSKFPPSECGGQNGCLGTFATDQIRGLEHVFSLRNTLQIAATSMSLGQGAHTRACDSDSRKIIIDQLRAANIATVIAAGNDGFDHSVNAPGCISSAITVASSTKQDQLSFFSNWGELIDVVAPGSGILASSINGNSNNFYGSLSGTSMATAHVAGAWAALRTRVPNATVTQIESVLESTGLRITYYLDSKPRIRVNDALTALLRGAPANDNFANGINIPTPATVTGDNTLATAENGEPLHHENRFARNSVWWRYTPASSGQINIDTMGSGFDTVLAVYTGSAVGALTLIASNDESDNTPQSRVTFAGVAGTQYQIAVAGFQMAQGSIRLRVSTPNIVSAVLPTARSTQVGAAVTALATVINAGNEMATGCSIALPAGTQNVAFTYRTVASDGTLGPINAPVDIPAGNGLQNFVMSFTRSTVGSTTIALVFGCANSSPAASVIGLNTFLLTAVATPVADIISTAATLTNDGILNVPQGGSNAAAYAAINIGSAAALQARISASSIGVPAATLPGSMFICQTNAQAQCLATPSTAVNFNSTTNSAVTFTAFFNSNGNAIPFDPANRRLFVNFFQGSIPVGSTSVAIRTMAPDIAAVVAASAN